ncbi:DUF4833 domain-containing protein [Phreatobacter sp.]|uniref:DUF4833 domain-containing protein n=1 Tax=Phreatobacter sp. TaxID=1966341 RepID=UPI003F707297
MPTRRLLVATAASAILPGVAARAQTDDRLPPIAVRRSEFTVSRQTIVARPDLPVPDDPDTLFYVQQAIDRNILVYAARRRPDGALDAARPVEVFWRRFNEDGRRRDLSFFERVFAFGISAEPAGQGRFRATLAAYREREATVDIGEDGKARALLRMGTRTVRVVYVYANVERGRFIPKVHHVDIHGIDLASGEAIRERVPISM